MVYYHTLSYVIIYFHIYYHLLSYIVNYYRLWSFSLIYYHLLSSIIICFHVLSYIVIYYHSNYHILSYIIYFKSLTILDPPKFIGWYGFILISHDFSFLKPMNIGKTLAQWQLFKISGAPMAAPTNLEELALWLRWAGTSRNRAGHSELHPWQMRRCIVFF